VRRAGSARHDDQIGPSSPVSASVFVEHQLGAKQHADLQSTDAVNREPGAIRHKPICLVPSGLVRSSFGRDGGNRLGRPADAITLREIYSAVLGDSGRRGRFPTSAS